MKIPTFSLLAVFLFLPTVGRADEDAGAAKPPTPTPEFCQKSRAPRLQSVQITIRRWLRRVDVMKAACTVGWVKTGAFTVNGNRIAPELRADVKCPKGPPPGETKESVWAALSLFLEEAPLTDETVEVGEPVADAANVRCVDLDASQGLVLRGVLVNDLPGLRRILAWKPADAGAP